MKRTGAVLVLGLFVSVFCFAQTQTGYASYNESKTGLTISHSSLSFNTRVRVTNLRNNRSVEAVVNGRIPITTEKIAEISREAGDALEMARNGMTQVRIEVLHVTAPETAAVPVQPAEPAPPVQETQTQAAAQPAAQRPVPESAARETARTDAAPPQTAAPPPASSSERVVTEVQYVPLAATYPAVPDQPRLGGPFYLVILIVILILLLLVIALLVVVLVLLLRGPSVWPLLWGWPRDVPVWLRRHFKYAKERRT
ncbi:MAG: hypothetical protein LBQ35_07245 [Spirochaetaceae bacterium]|jgi:hypothetical protein|nr:hypothetical protein [Spirochaetaceae bacterium]